MGSLIFKILVIAVFCSSIPLCAASPSVIAQSKGRPQLPPLEQRDGLLDLDILCSKRAESDSHECHQLTGKVLSELIGACHSIGGGTTGSLTIVHASIAGTLDLDSKDISCNLTLKDVKFLDKVQFDGTKFMRALTFSHVYFFGGFDALNLDVDGVMRIENSVVRKGLRLGNARVNKNFEIVTSRFDAPVNAEGLHISGNFSVAYTSFAAPCVTRWDDSSRKSPAARLCHTGRLSSNFCAHFPKSSHSEHSVLCNRRSYWSACR